VSRDSRHPTARPGQPIPNAPLRHQGQRHSSKIVNAIAPHARLRPSRGGALFEQPGLEVIRLGSATTARSSKSALDREADHIGGRCPACAASAGLFDCFEGESSWRTGPTVASVS